jgi:hypothetical protein
MVGPSPPGPKFLGRGTSTVIRRAGARASLSGSPKQKQTAAGSCPTMLGTVKIPNVSLWQALAHGSFKTPEVLHRIKKRLD